MLKVTLEYQSSPTEAMVEAVWQGWPGIQERFSERGKFTADNWWSIHAAPVRMTMDEVEALVQLGVPVKLEADVGTMLTKMVDRGMRNGQDISAEDLRHSRTVQIAVADVGLMHVRQVTWLEDCCTEELQAQLDAGWRILAVCPPNARRRPDYILGRTNKE
jgi:hypothetical protein